MLERQEIFLLLGVEISPQIKLVMSDLFLDYLIQGILHQEKT